MTDENLIRDNTLKKLQTMLAENQNAAAAVTAAEILADTVA